MRTPVENDARMYWRLMRSFNSVVPDHEVDPDVVDELDVLSIHTDSETLGRLCRQAVNRASLYAKKSDAL